MKFTHNQKVRCTIKGVDITDARISIDENGRPFICHNESRAEGSDAYNKLGYQYSWRLDKDFTHVCVTNLRPDIKSFDDPQVGDEYRDNDGNSRLVLGVSGRVIHMSMRNNKDAASSNWTKEELINLGYTIVQDEEEEVTEMTVAEISKALGKTVKVVEYRMTTPRIEEKTFEEKSKSEEWGAWKFVSEMLDTPHPDPELAKCGIYNTSKCYEQIHDFVVEQKKKAHQAGRDEAVEVLKKKRNGHCGKKDCLQAYCINRKIIREFCDDTTKALQNNK